MFVSLATRQRLVDNEMTNWKDLRDVSGRNLYLIEIRASIPIDGINEKTMKSCHELASTQP